MADFSQYTGPSQEWIALEPSLPKPPELTVEELKEATNKGRDAVAAEEMKSQGLAEKVTIRDLSIRSRDGSVIDARYYRPSHIPTSRRLPVYIHLHGGGFVFGTIPSEDANCSRAVVALTNASLPIVVVNINYRHTPEHKYPTAWNDVEDGFHWIHDHLDEIGGDGSQVVMGGTSAGAWLTASLILQQLNGLGTKGLPERPKIRGQVLMIPALVHMDCYDGQRKRLKDRSSGSLAVNQNAPVLPFKIMKLFIDLLEVPVSEAVEDNIKLNPGNATADQVKGLPPTAIGVAGRDMLRDEGLLFAQLLAENGVSTDVTVFPGVPHGFRRFGAKLSACERWDEVIHKGIQWTLSNPEATNRFEINAFKEPQKPNPVEAA